MIYQTLYNVINVCCQWILLKSAAGFCCIMKERESEWLFSHLFIAVSSESVFMFPATFLQETHMIRPTNHEIRWEDNRAFYLNHLFLRYVSANISHTVLRFVNIPKKIKLNTIQYKYWIFMFVYFWEKLKLEMLPWQLNEINDWK